MLKIRLARAGAKKRPYYRIVVADIKAPRDGKYIERLGTYNPMLAKNDDNRVRLLTDRIKYWMSEGAQPTDRVAMFLGDAGLIEKPKFNNPNKAKPSEKTVERQKEKAEKLAAAKEVEAVAPVEETTSEAVAEEDAAETEKVTDVPTEEVKTED